MLHSILNAPPFSLFFPYAPITSIPSSSHGLSSLPPPLISSSYLATVSRKHLVDALVKLTRALANSRHENDLWKRLVIELSLEYSGRRWRMAMEKGEEDVVEGIGRKLLEIEFDVCPTFRAALVV